MRERERAEKQKERQRKAWPALELEVWPALQLEASIPICACACACACGPCPFSDMRRPTGKVKQPREPFWHSGYACEVARLPEALRLGFSKTGLTGSRKTHKDPESASFSTQTWLSCGTLRALTKLHPGLALWCRWPCPPQGPKMPNQLNWKVTQTSLRGHPSDWLRSNQQVTLMSLLSCLATFELLLSHFEGWPPSSLLSHFSLL